MKYILYIAIFCFYYQVSGQVVFDKINHDFGEINPDDTRFVDFKLTNTSAKKAYILHINQPSEVVYIKQGDVLENDSSIFLRFQVNPTKKGKFNYIISVHLSDRNKPVKLKLTGELLSSPENTSLNFTQCPTFGSNPAGKNPLNFELYVTTIDEKSNKSIPNSTVLIMQNGQALGKWETDKNGVLRVQIPLGITYFQVRQKNYEIAEIGTYVNFKRNKITIPLTPNAISSELAEKRVEQAEQEDVGITQNIDDEYVVDTVLPVRDTVSFASLGPNNFNSSQFKPVHTVFIIDVSSSMKQADRLELMKHSLINLSQMLRAEDKIGIVSYASNPEVLLRPTQGNKKAQITPIIEKIKAGGVTDGGAGIRKGLRMARWNINKQGVNHVFIISDGAFNRSSGNYKRWIRMSKRRGIKMSVVGIKTKDKDVEKMKEIAALGGGEFIAIKRLSDASKNLKYVVRKSAFIF